MSDKTYYYWQGVVKKDVSSAGGISFGVIADSMEDALSKVSGLFKDKCYSYYEFSGLGEYWFPGIQFKAVADGFTQFVKQEHEEEGK